MLPSLVAQRQRHQVRKLINNEKQCYAINPEHCVPTVPTNTVLTTVIPSQAHSANAQDNCAMTVRRTNQKLCDA